MFTKEEIDALVQNTKYAIPYLKKEIQDLQALIPSDEQIEQIYEKRNLIANMMRNLSLIEKQLQESKAF